jgi:uncharacterized protein YycO
MMKKRFISIIPMALVLGILLVSGASLAATPENTNDILVKEVLTENDWNYIQSVDAAEREVILTQRGWTKIEFPENINSYADLISDRDKAILGSEGLEAAIENCETKEIPFSEFKQMERWIPSEKELRLNHDIIGGWGGSEGDEENDCDFSLSGLGDIVLTHPDGFCAWGWHSHAAIVRYSYSDDQFAIGSDSDHGVRYNSKDHLHGLGPDYYNYDFARVMDVNTTPCSVILKYNASDFAEDQLGKPYNWIFIDKWTISKFYCSQLSWSGYWYESSGDVCIDGIPDDIDFGAVSPDAIYTSWRTSTVTSSW